MPHQVLKRGKEVVAEVGSGCRWGRLWIPIHELFDLGYEVRDTERFRNHVVLVFVSILISSQCTHAQRASSQHTMPASNAVWICSLRAFAVTAITGTWQLNLPSFSNSRIFLVHVRPSMTGIS